MPAAGGRHVFAVGEVLTSANAQNFLMDQTIMYFATAATRTAGITSPTAGMVTFRADGNSGAGIIEYYTGATWQAIPISSGSTGINRNALLNADFQINQRGFTSNTATLAYNFDRWMQQNSGGTCTVTPQTFTPGAAPISGTWEARNYVQLITATQAAAGDFAILTQRIEDVTKFAGQAITISFFAKAGSGTPSIGVEVQQNFGTGGSPSATVSTPIAAKAITTGWAQYSVTVTVPSITGKTLGTTANTSYLEVNLWISSGATNATRASSIGIQNNTFSIWGVKLEAGSTLSSFSLAHDSLEAELAACQRYYWRNAFVSNGTPISWGFVNSATNALMFVKLPVTMRATPTMGTDGTATHYSIQAAAGTFQASSISLWNFNNTEIVSLIYTIAGATAGQGALGTTSTSAFMDFTAEL